MEKNKLVMIIVILVLAVMLAAVGFGFIYTINMIKTVQQPAAPETSQQQQIQAYDVNTAITIPLSDSIKANLLPESDGKEHLALVSMSIGIAGPQNVTKKEQKAIQKEIDALVMSVMSGEVIVRDLAIRQLRKSTYSELRRADGQEIYGDQLLEELQNAFNTNLIVDVYFGEFFLQ